jgi:hypothetical protein
MKPVTWKGYGKEVSGARAPAQGTLVPLTRWGAALARYSSHRHATVHTGTLQFTPARYSSHRHATVHTCTLQFTPARYSSRSGCVSATKLAVGDHLEVEVLEGEDE